MVREKSPRANVPREKGLFMILDDLRKELPDYKIIKLSWLYCGECGKLSVLGRDEFP